MPPCAPTLQLQLVMKGADCHSLLVRWLLVVGRWLGVGFVFLCCCSRCGGGVVGVVVGGGLLWWVCWCFVVLVLCLVCCVVGLSLDLEGKGGRRSVLRTGRQDEALRTGPPGPGRALAFYRYS